MERCSSVLDSVLRGHAQVLSHPFKSRSEIRDDWSVIKYLGSKRTLLPLIGTLISSSGANSVLDLFAGTTRIAHEAKRQGKLVTTVDTASYSKVFGDTWIALDSNSVDQRELTDALAHLNSLEPEAGYFTKNFCLEARYFQPFNGERIDAIRSEIARTYSDSWLEAPLISSLLLAADRVDSTTGVQMAYLKQWTRRSYKPIELLDPGLLAGGGVSLQQDANVAVRHLPPMDLAYIDPPYNQHRYFGNYHVWESLVRWDKPQTYGIANKRTDVKDPANRSDFNSRKTMPAALGRVLRDVKAEVIVLSYNNESWISREELVSQVENRGSVEILDVEFKRYIGSQIGIYNKSGTRVGEPGAKQNLEHILLAGPKRVIAKMLDAAGKS